MMRRIGYWAGLSLLTATAAMASTMGPLVTDKPVSWHGNTIRLGEADAAVRRDIGRYPDSAQPLYANDSDPRYVLGERWMYLGDKADPSVLWIEFTHRRVTRAWTESPAADGESQASP
ncbi:hypothetical protein [Solimonas marina]|uniref:Nickel/cobalt transporter regulator n=1 Tax=Solimonas marina TaxID=2714601 RepID=A0A970B684_9GAMM|nr:hypothetical protein [Solimonas marina]NKF22370.1 hypothetical protein [Solimonas marina]